MLWQATPRTANFISISPDAAERTKVVGSSNSTNYVPPHPQNQSRMTSRWRPVRQSHLAFLCLDFFMCKMEIVLVYSALQRVLVMYSAVVRAVGARIMVFFLKKKTTQKETKACKCTCRQPKCNKALYLYDHCLHAEAILLWQMVDFYIWNSFRCQSATNSLIKRNQHFRDDAPTCLCALLHP